MSILKYIEKFQRIDTLISKRATGTPDEFASRLGVRRSTLFQYLQEIKEKGVEIKYSHLLRSYYYADGKRISIRIEQFEANKNIIQISEQ